MADDKVLIKKRPEKWTVDDVCQWIVELGLPQYEDNFSVHQIDGQELLHLDDNALQKSLGIGRLTLLISEWPKLHRVLAVLSAKGLRNRMKNHGH